MKKIKEYIAGYKEQSRLQKEAQLKAEFKVVERDGYLWLTHKGVAFTNIDKGMLAEDVAALLKEARNTAVEFEKA